MVMNGRCGTGEVIDFVHFLGIFKVANIGINKLEILVCQNGAGVPFSEEKAKEILLEKEIEIIITCGDGDACATAWGCDLTYDYVKINGDYRT